MRVRPFEQKVTRTVQADQSVLAYGKYYDHDDAAGAEVTVSTIQVLANLLQLTVNAAPEVGVGTYTGNSGTDDQIVYADEGTVRGLVEIWNCLPHYAQTDVLPYRWIASYGDFRPGYVIGAGDGLAAGPDSSLLGKQSMGYPVFADSSGLAVANAMSVVLGGPNTKFGTYPFLPSHRESDYISTTGGVVTRIRNMIRRREEQPSAFLQSILTSCHAAAAYANNDKLLEFYDIDDTLLWAYFLGANNDIPENVLSEESPLEGTMGSPIWVELSGTGAFTDGPLSVSGYIHVA